MRVRLFLNRSENVTLDQLERVLAGTAYQTYVKPRLKDVIEPSPNESLFPAERRMLDHGHLDFLVVNRPANTPEFVIEFDGPTHKDSRQLRRDRVKDDLCLRADLPILRLGTEEIALREQCSMLEWLLERFINYRRVCKPQRDPDGYLWVPAPAWEFDLEHTMPAITAVIARLYKRFGVGAHDWWAWGGPTASLAPAEDAMLSVLPDRDYLDSLGLLPRDMHDAHTPSFSDTGEAIVVLCRTGQDEPVHVARGRVTITEREVWHGGMLDSIFGFAYEDAQACLAEYIALRDVERWAMRHLMPLAA